MSQELKILEIKNNGMGFKMRGEKNLVGKRKKEKF
jgi:hypothetical protein